MLSYRQKREPETCHFAVPSVHRYQTHCKHGHRRRKQRNSIFGCEGRCAGGNSSLLACVADDKLQPVHLTLPLYMTCRCRTQALTNIYCNCRNVSTFRWVDFFNTIHVPFWYYNEDFFLSPPPPPPVSELTVLQRLDANCTSVRPRRRSGILFSWYFCTHTELVLHITSSDNPTLCLLIPRNTTLTITASFLIKGYNIKQKLYVIPDMWFSGTGFYPEDRVHLKSW
jgi:hypothetical protein